MAAEDARETFFHGHTNWYVRAVVWFAQTLAAGLLLRFALGQLGVAVTGLASALLLFRQVDGHVETAIARE